MPTDAEGTRSGASPFRLGRRGLVLGFVAALSILAAWDAAQLTGPDGAARRHATAETLLHPWRLLDVDSRTASVGASSPLWIADGRVRPEAARLVALLADAGREGLDPRRFDVEGLKASLQAARGGERGALAEAERRLSDAVAAYAQALRQPAPDARLAFVDPAIAAAPTSREAVLRAAADAPSLERFLDGLKPGNPLYLGLRQALAEHRAARAAAGAPPGPDAYERLLLANLDRTRALPDDLGERYIVVDVAEQMLRLYEHGRPVDEMPVVVGKISEPTPMMIGLIRYAMFNPYWNVPEDLARFSIAPQVLKHGLGYLRAKHLEVLSDWSAAARPIDPAGVDWQAVADGRISLRVRQTPGPDNMMGRVKFMLPNGLGIYLHDTPVREAFRHWPRTFSSGCVRLQDAPRLARRLLGRDAAPSPAAEARVDLQRPVPVYIVYLTARPDRNGVTLAPDIYGRDPPMTALAAKP